MQVIMHRIILGDIWVADEATTFTLLFFDIPNPTIS